MHRVCQLFQSHLEMWNHCSTELAIPGPCARAALSVRENVPPEWRALFSVRRGRWVVRLDWCLEVQDASWMDLNREGLAVGGEGVTRIRKG